MTFLTDQDQYEKTLTTKEIYKGTIVRIRVDEAELPNGLVCKREVVEHPGGVVVCATLDNGKLILVKQFRYPLGHVLYEFPAGKLDPGELPEVSIKRELEEETGYNAEHWEELTYIYTSPGFCNERLTLYKAQGLKLSENPRREEDEFIQVLEVTPEEIRQMIRDKKIIDAKTICAFALCYPGGLS
jgi:ADP-ribose pyrophosphatase